MGEIIYSIAVGGGLVVAGFVMLRTLKREEESLQRKDQEEGEGKS